MELELEKYGNIAMIRANISDCQTRNHVQQVAYSTYHDAFTQVCFACKKVRTNMKIED